MHLSWKERLESSREYRDIRNWHLVDPSTLKSDIRRKYIRNCSMIAEAIEGTPLVVIAKKYDITVAGIVYLLNRALAGDDSKPPELTAALIPGNLIKKAPRKSPLSKLGSKRGSRGAFTLILDTVPGLREKLDNILLASITKKPYGQNVTPQIFHKEFLKYLLERNWPSDQYPFDQKNLANESCRLYYNNRKAELLIKPEPKKRQVLSLLTNKVPFDEIQIDSQVMDLHCSCNFEINGELLPLRLSRLSIYYAIDVATDCILSYKICFTQHPNQQDVTDLIIGIIKPWKPMHLKIPGLKYSPEACLPSNLGVEFRAIAINMIRMDNALCHMAHSIRDLICHKLNATLNFGLPKRPKGRNYIEHAIAIISKDLHRFESTTGSNPNSHIKEKGGSNKKIPVITLDALEEVLSVLITDHNIKSQAKLNRSSPLQVLKQYVSQNYMNLNPTQIHIANSLHLKQKVVPVKWIKSENRRPHINFENLRYTGNCLSAKELQNKEVIVEYDESDIRTLKVLSLDGKPIGTVVAPRTWQSKRHSVRTRSRIFKIVKHERSLSADPLSGYFNYIYEKRHLPKYATELARIFREFSSQTFHTEDISSASNDDTSSDSTQLGSKRRKHKIPTWTPEIELLPVRRG